VHHEVCHDDVQLLVFEQYMLVLLMGLPSAIMAIFGGNVAPTLGKCLPHFMSFAVFVLLLILAIVVLVLLHAVVRYFIRVVGVV